MVSPDMSTATDEERQIYKNYLRGSMLYSDDEFVKSDIKVIESKPAKIVFEDIYGEIEINLGKKIALTLQFCVTILRFGCSQKCLLKYFFLHDFTQNFHICFVLKTERNARHMLIAGAEVSVSKQVCLQIL